MIPIKIQDRKGLDKDVYVHHVHSQNAPQHSSRDKWLAKFHWTIHNSTMDYIILVHPNLEAGRPLAKTFKKQIIHEKKNLHSHQKTYEKPLFTS